MRNETLIDPVHAEAKWYLRPHARFVLFGILFCLLFAVQLRDILVMSWKSEYYSYIPFIPVISGYFLFTDRRMIFSPVPSTTWPGLAGIAAGCLLLVLGRTALPDLDYTDQLSLVACSLIIIGISGFAACYGMQSFYAALFPLLFLFFAVPLPNALREGIIRFLQSGSTEAADLLLRLSGLHYVREGFVFHLGWTDIEVAKECSGIRSSLSLIVTGALAGHMFLRSVWARAAFLGALIPIAIIKNGIRIATLTLLGTYWDARILDSDLHRKGGIVFFLAALGLAGLLIGLLRKLEAKRAGKKP